jgi:hypothetical protein
MSPERERLLGNLLEAKLRLFRLVGHKTPRREARHLDLQGPGGREADAGVDLLRDGLSLRDVAGEPGIAKSTVKRMKDRAVAEGLSSSAERLPIKAATLPPHYN